MLRPSEAYTGGPGLPLVLQIYPQVAGVMTQLELIAVSPDNDPLSFQCVTGTHFTYHIKSLLEQVYV